MKISSTILLPLVLLGCGHISGPGPMRTAEPAVSRGWSYIEPEKEFLDMETGVDAVSFSSPVLADEKLVFGSERFGITVLAKRNGQLLWRRKLDEGVMAQPLVAGNMLYVGSEAGTLYAFDLKSGKELWNVPLGMPVQGSPLIAFQRLFVGTQDEALHALDPLTGKVLWTYRRQAFAGTSVHGGGNPAAINGKIWEGFSDGSLVALNPDTGSVDVEKQFRDNLKFSDLDARVVGWHDGMLVATYDGKLRYLRKDGTVVWEFANGGSRAPILGDGDVIYFPSSDGTLYALSGTTGKELWNYPIRRGVPTGVALYTWHNRKLVLMAASEERVIVLDSLTGRLLGQTSLGRGSGSYGAIAADPDTGQFFVLSQSSRVHQFHLNF